MSTKWSVFVALFSAIVANPSAFALDAVTVAESFLTSNVASKYADGGNGPTDFDCSGLTWYAFGHVGIEIAFTSTEQETMPEGTKLAWPKVSDLQRGDLLFFDTRDTYAGTVNHVGIYEGGGNFLHAASKTLGLISSNLNTGWISYKNGVRWTDRLLSSRRLPRYSGTPSTWFSIGNRVEVVSDNVEVRKLRQGTLLETKGQGAKGTIKFGPATRSIYGLPYWWWLVDFESGKDGWVVEEDLKKVGGGGDAEIVYTNGDPFSGTGSSGVHYAKSDTVSPKQISADDFELANTVTVDRVRWWGVWNYYIPTTNNFTIKFYSSKNGLPDASSVVATRYVGNVPGIPTGKVRSYFEVLEFSANITPVTFQAGVDYWVSIYDNSGSDTSQYFIWRATETPGSAAFDDYDPNWHSWADGLAFQLEKR